MPAGEPPEVIAGQLGRTCQWVARYDPDDAGWADGRSRAPRRVARRAAADAETARSGYRACRANALTAFAT